MYMGEILLVEDNPGDVRLIEIALQRAGIDATLNVVRDGESALAFLRKEPPFEGKPTPTLVLLDLNLPGIDGRDVLSAVKRDPVLRRLPVVVLTSSQAEADVIRAYELHANSYISKPSTLSGLQQAVQAIHAYWFQTVRLPDSEPMRRP